MKKITKNDKQIAMFSEVRHLQIRTIGGRAVTHRLTAVLVNGEKIEIDNAGDLSEINALADDVADIIGTKVIHKE